MSDEFVMVPREWVETTVAAGAGEVMVLSDIATLAECLSQQHQGEPVLYEHTLLSGRGGPVAWVVTAHADHPFGNPGVDYGKQLSVSTEPLYRRAGSGEVERTLECQRREFSHAQTVEHRKWAELVDSLKVRQAKLDALLSSAYSEMERANNCVGQCISCGEPPEDDGIITHDPACTFCAMEIATYASEESSAMADIGERADILADAAYRNGVMHGYKLAMEGSEAEYQACINSLTGHLHAARAALSASAEPSGPIEIDDLRIHLEAMCKLWPEDLSDDGSGRMGFKSEVAATVAKARAALVRKP